MGSRQCLLFDYGFTRLNRKRKKNNEDVHPIPDDAIPSTSKQQRVDDINTETSEEQNLDGGDGDDNQPSEESTDEQNQDGGELPPFRCCAVYEMEVERLGIDLNQITSLDEFKEKLKKELLSKNDKLKHKALNPSRVKCRSYTLMYFYYQSDKNSEKQNFTATQVAKQRGRDATQFYPGDRRTGIVVVFMRMVESTNQPETFFVCQGDAYNCIIHLASSTFRTKIAKRFIDGNKIDSIEYMNIAGPNISTAITFKSETDIMSQRSTYITAFISKLSGKIKKDSKLNVILQDKRSDKEVTGIKMTIGINFVKFMKKLTWEQMAEALKLFSKIMDQSPNVEESQSHLIDALDNIQQITSRNKMCELDKEFADIAIDILTGKGNTDDFHLSHRYIKDWSSSSDIILYQTQGMKKRLKRWYSRPGLPDLIKLLKNLFPDIGELRKYLKEKTIKMEYHRPLVAGGKQPILPVQKYVHGLLSKKDGTYFKVGQRWYCLSASFYKIIDKMFSCMSNLVLEDQNIKEILHYPWNFDNRKVMFDPKSKMFQNLLDVNDQVKLEKILNILTEKYHLFHITTGDALYKDYSCLLPESSEICRQLKPKKPIKHKRQENIQIDTDDVDQYPGPSSSADAEKSTKLAIDDDVADGIPFKGKESVRQKLFNIYNGLKRDRATVQKTITVLKKMENAFKVNNCILTEDVVTEVHKIEPSLKEERLFNVLKSMSGLNEGEYNELYLFSNEPDGYFVLPGDKIITNGVELFDVLIHDKRLRKTYLFQNKAGLDYHTRDACAQIRCSAELLWHDFITGHKTHIKLFWNKVMESDANSPYRHFLKAKLSTIKKEEFFQMFDDDVKLVFVLGIAPTTKRERSFLKWDFKKITRSSLAEFENEYDTLLKHEIVNGEGYLTDSFIEMTQKTFKDTVKLEQKRSNSLYNFLTKHGSCKLSTIAKLELLTLDNAFNNFQLGGGGRENGKFILKIFEIESSKYM